MKKIIISVIAVAGLIGMSNALAAGKKGGAPNMNAPVGSVITPLKKSGAANQGQPVGSVVTSGALATAIINAIAESIAVTGMLPSGNIQVLIDATNVATGASTTVPATLAFADGQVTVTYGDGSSETFSVSDYV